MLTIFIHARSTPTVEVPNFVIPATSILTVGLLMLILCPLLIRGVYTRRDNHLVLCCRR